MTIDEYLKENELTDKNYHLIKRFECVDCKKDINVSDGTIIIKCLNCDAIYAVGEEICLVLSGEKTIEKAKLRYADILIAI